MGDITGRHYRSNVNRLLTTISQISTFTSINDITEGSSGSIESSRVNKDPNFFGKKEETRDGGKGG